MSVGTLTVTGDIGPDIALTAKVFANVLEFAVNIDEQLLTIHQTNKITTIDISAVVTFTVTLSAAAGNYTISLS